MESTSSGLPPPGEPPVGTLPEKLVLECPSCTARFNLKKYIPDRRVRCRKCRSIMRIPIVEEYLTPEQKEKLQQARAKPLDPKLRATLVRAFSMRRLLLTTFALCVALAGATYLFYKRARRPVSPVVEKKERRITVSWLERNNRHFDYPMWRGYSWAYVLTRPKAGVTNPVWEEEREVVQLSGGPDDEPQFEVAISHPDGGYRQTVRIATEGVLLLGESRGGERYTWDPPYPLLRFPLAPGNVWLYEGSLVKEGGRAERWESEFRVGTEVVETGIGKRECFRIDVKSKRGSALVEESHWIASGVGLVKRSVRAEGKEEESRLSRFKQ